ncbi:hypothetical protein ACHAXA_000047 [Cyclostephanos tholiformis]|uniref:Ubiquitin carboxyl-terminal hydrolase n=1 Tax=Cyclostephanos tholiformis TaxID=382380 RepID=A0ABD3SRT6_9STRA
MADRCPHLTEPTDEAWNRLRNPLRWACDSCQSTDGIWCCLRCGHIGCGRRAHLPALGGGHSKHHFHATQQGTEENTAGATSGDGNKKRAKILKILRLTSNYSDKADAAATPDIVSSDVTCNIASSGGHEVCMDIVSKALHCYICDDYVLSDEPWLGRLRSELRDVEHRKDAMDILYSRAPSADDKEQEEKGFLDDDFEMIELPETGPKLATASFEGKSEEASGVKPISLPLVEPGITGLDNLGNTCYMNSVLQMLSHCSGFRSFFCDFLRAAAPLRLAGEGGYTLTRQSTTYLKNTLHENESPDKLALTDATHALLRVLWSGRWRSISPRYFVNAVWKHSALFASKKQQDANEFLNFYLGRVDDELKPRNATNSVMSPELEIENTNRSHVSLYINITFFQMDLFGIEQYQEVQCDECKTVTKKTEPLLGLVLSLPDEEIRNSNNHIQLFDCFQSLRSTGLFVGDDQFFCDTCNAKKDAVWRVVLQGRPQSLLISLRRTLWDKVKGLHKDSRRVEFPVELDASDYLDVGNEKGVDDGRYTLSAVVSHSGSSPFVGHYIAYARNVSGWFLFNDSRVTAVTESNILDVEAFILLYERRTISSIE